MKIIIVCGFKNFPWTEMRRNFARYFNAEHLIPDYDPYNSSPAQNNSSHPSTAQVPIEPAAEIEPAEIEPAAAATVRVIRPRRPIRTPQPLPGRTFGDQQIAFWSQSDGGAAAFWKRILRFARKKEIAFGPFGTVLIEENVGRRLSNNTTGRSNLIQKLLDKIFTKAGADENFHASLALAMKSGNMENLIDTVRRHLRVPDLYPGLVPCVSKIKQSTKIIMQHFIGMCQPEKTFSGWRVDLMCCVKLAVFMRWGVIDLTGVRLDLWGDGAKVGGVEQTRLVFRILGGPHDDDDPYLRTVSAQSAKAAYCFVCFRGKDNRYGLEQNVGFQIVGEQKSGWLFNQTTKLRNSGVKLTFSGDDPFLHRLVARESSDLSNKFPSDMSIYFGTSATPLPTDVGEDGLRTSLRNLPFVEGVPKTALVNFGDVRCVAPDVTHMVTRCVENDIQKMGKKIINECRPYHKEALKKFEENLTRREVQKPTFSFDMKTTNGTITLGDIKLPYGSGALTAIADKEELFDLDPTMTDLYDGVWGNQVVYGPHTSNCGQVLKRMYPELFNKPRPGRPNERSDYISVYDAAELQRKSLNRCVTLLRDSKDGFDLEEFSTWAETYYQTTLLLFTETGLTPYKLKLLLIPELVRSGYISNLWDHMCEGLEKSNHHSSGTFHSKTLRGGGCIHHQNPLFLELFFSFARLLSEETSVLQTFQEAIRAIFADGVAPITVNYISGHIL